MGVPGFMGLPHPRNIYSSISDEKTLRSMRSRRQFRAKVSTRVTEAEAGEMCESDDENEGSTITTEGGRLRKRAKTADPKEITAKAH